ncbi:MAG: class 1 isoprenoid biosynthesis enzyme, partial [Prolixibacteraceae bacterium]|nr:class 1 isoprenoid biosynthesis enzyme [Prolixibacteraceae bacterium]
MLQNYTEQYAGIWDGCATRMPEFSKKYSKADKLRKEQFLDQFLNTVKTFRKDRVNGKVISEADQELFFTNTRGFLRNGLDFTDYQLEMMFSDEMIGLTRSFVRQARAFDSQLSFSDIFQACRNMWIMSGLQLVMGIPLEVTPAVFAYCMLYPYTDNLIDDPQISGFEKMVFSERFQDRLSGVILKPVSGTEDSIFRLVEMIENQYSRAEFPEVFESLLAIHQAQTDSLKLIQHPDELSETEILKICLAKGGASVLADGYLVAGKLTEAQRYFLFGYGAYLQLLDDVQDVEEDRQAGLVTIFSGSVFGASMDEKLNKTYWFGEYVMQSLGFF